MRIRPIYIVIVIIIGIGGFVLYAALSKDSSAPTVTPPPAASSNSGMLPPADTNQDLVPVLEVETDRFDMGTVSNESATTQEMTVKNTGSQKLIIRQISTSCGCTTGKISSREIMPGQSATLEITVNPNRIPGFYSHKRLTLMSNAPNAPMQNIDVIARIEPEFEVVPEEVLDFGEVQKGERVQGEVLLRQLGDKPIELLDVKMLKEEAKGVTFEYALRPKSEWQKPGKPEYTITATLDPFVPPGEYTHTYFIVTSCKRIPRYRHKIAATVKSFYELSQNELTFSMRSGQSKEKPLVSLEVKADRPIEVVDPEITGEDFSLQIIPAADGNSIAIEVFLTSKSTPGRKNETLTFFVKAKKGKPLPNLVPVRGMVMN